MLKDGYSGYNINIIMTRTRYNYASINLCKIYFKLKDYSQFVNQLEYNQLSLFTSSCPSHRSGCSLPEPSWSSPPGSVHSPQVRGRGRGGCFGIHFHTKLHFHLLVGWLQGRGGCFGSSPYSPADPSRCSHTDQKTISHLPSHQSMAGHCHTGMRQENTVEAVSSFLKLKLSWSLST